VRFREKVSGDNRDKTMKDQVRRIVGSPKKALDFERKRFVGGKETRPVRNKTDRMTFRIAGFPKERNLCAGREGSFGREVVRRGHAEGGNHGVFD